MTGIETQRVGSEKIQDQRLGDEEVALNRTLPTRQFACLTMQLAAANANARGAT